MFVFVVVCYLVHYFVLTLKISNIHRPTQLVWAACLRIRIFGITTWQRSSETRSHFWQFIKLSDTWQLCKPIADMIFPFSLPTPYGQFELNNSYLFKLRCIWEDVQIFKNGKVKENTQTDYEGIPSFFQNNKREFWSHIYPLAKKIFSDTAFEFIL